MDTPDTDPFATLHLEHSSTVDRVAEELRRAIFDGELESGTPLRELALAGSLQVSRPTVREALGALVSEGLVTREPNRGVSVATPDPESIHDVCRARVVLEIAGVRSWPDAPEPLRQAVRDALAAFASAAGGSGPGSSYQVLNERHLAFHLSLVGLVGSPRLQAMATALYAELRLALAQVDRARQNAPDQAG
ncbi:MAG: GntR family transcriptional regulator, partial [Nocardioides sp.]